MADNQDWEIREIKNPNLTLPNPHPTFHGRDVFAHVAAHLAAGVPFPRVGPVVVDPVLFDVPKPLEIKGGIQGEVIYVDRFGNLSCNINENHLKRGAAVVEIGNTRIRGISSYFGQAPEGTALALVNSFGLLEIAVNRGDASKALGVSLAEAVKVYWA
jgi:S-adenosylmethionine hydrolase